MKRKTFLALAVAFLCSLSLSAAEAPDVEVSNVTFRQRYPWNGLVDIDCDVACSDATADLSLSVTARDNVSEKPLVTRRVWLEGDATHTNALKVKAGHHRLVWDAVTDNPDVVSTNVTVELQALAGGGLYLVIDLADGVTAASYPVSYLAAPPAGGWTDDYKTTKLVLRRIEPGTFTMGSPAAEVGRYPNEDQHVVTLTRPYYMGVFQVTQKQYELVTGGNPSYYGGDMRPVECVSWNDIRGESSLYDWPGNRAVDPETFVGRLRAKAGLGGVDLPTEAQWEYACRAGTTTALNSGKDLSSAKSDSAMDELGCYNKRNGHEDVGQYKPNAWELYDMHGNVWEWCLDWYGAYAGDAEDPVGPESGESRVGRGGGWYGQARSCRSAYRLYDSLPSDYFSSVGFRLCCDAEGL